MILVLAVQVWESANRSSGVVYLHAWLARIAVAIVAAVAVAGVGFGTMAVRCAAARKQPAGLAVAGLSLSVAALLLWAITAIGLLNTTESLLLLYGR